MNLETRSGSEDVEMDDKDQIETLGLAAGEGSGRAIASAYSFAH